MKKILLLLAFLIFSTDFATAQIIGFNPDTLDFGKVCVGNSKEMTGIFENFGTGSITIMAMAPVNSNPFEVNKATLNLPSAIPAGGTLNIDITCTPTQPGSFLRVFKFVGDYNGFDTVNLVVKCEAVLSMSTEAASNLFPAREIKLFKTPNSQALDTTIRFYNGSSGFTITSVSTTSPFVIMNGNNFPHSTQKNWADSIKIQFTAQNSGNYNASLIIRTYINCQPDSIVVTLKGLVSTPPPATWNFVSNTGNSATIAIPNAIKPSTGTRLLTKGDAVGVFFVSGADTISGGYGIWQDENLTLTIWGDNDQTTLKDGFAPGDTILYRVWDGQAGTSYNALATYQSGSQLYSKNNVYVLSSLGVRVNMTQTLSLNAGWNTFSSYVLPETTNLDVITAPIQPSLLLMKNGAGDIYWPSLGINEIGAWNFQHGYQAYMLAGSVLPVRGLKSIPEATGLSLEKGWNLVSYLRRSNIDIASALGGISTALVAARDNDGKVYWPALGIKALDSMRAGNGYYIMMSQPATLTYPSDIEGIAYKDKSPDEVLSAAGEKKKPVHFTFRSNTGKNAVIGIPATSINGTVPNAEGDEIGVFANGKCVGASVWEGKNTAITVWGDDDQTQEKDGINPGEQMEIRVWRKAADSEFTATAMQFKSGAGLKATNIFEADAIYEVASVTTGIEEISENSNVQIVYNSANEVIQVTLADAQNSTIELLDVNGKQLRSLQSETQISSISTVGIPSGAYFVQVKIGNEVSYKKIIIAR